MKTELVLDTRQGAFFKESLCFFGILLQNNLSNTISKTLTKQKYLKITEGFITTPEIYTEVRNQANIVVFKKNKKIIEKFTDKAKGVKIINDDAWTFDLYNCKEREKLYNLIQNWEKNKKIYLKNTEILPAVKNCDSIAGVASGYGVAKLAHQSKAKKVIFFDYNQKALEFQKDLINEKNRKKVVYRYQKFLTLGRPIHIGEKEINQINFKFLNEYYNNLQNCDVNFLHIDVRNKSDIERLFSFLSPNTHLWLSNVLHYSTNIFSYDPMLYMFIDTLAKKNNIKTFPFTRIYYEGKTDSEQK